MLCLYDEKIGKEAKGWRRKQFNKLDALIFHFPGKTQWILVALSIGENLKFDFKAMELGVALLKRIMVLYWNGAGCNKYFIFAYYDDSSSFEVL